MRLDGKVAAITGAGSGIGRGSQDRPMRRIWPSSRAPAVGSVRSTIGSSSDSRIVGASLASSPEIPWR